MLAADFTFARAFQPAAAAIRYRCDRDAARYETRLSLTIIRPTSTQAAARGTTLAMSHPLLLRIPQVVPHASEPALAAGQPAEGVPRSVALGTAPPVPMTTRRSPAPPAPALDHVPPRRLERAMPDVRALALAPDVIRAVSDQVVSSIDRRMLARREQLGRT
jgi:hypothetical protein